MLIKEYRIPLPLSVDEYRVAQLYMIAKKSREETHGVGSGVEILVNEPYTDGPGGEGQYTHKIYHVGQHLPGWLKALLPKSALTVEEQAWNAYPYTKTRYTCPFIEKFFIEIETKYFGDGGDQENVFDLSSELKTRIVDVINIVKDQLYGADYEQVEDPNYFHSEKTNRGPLSANWVEEYCKNKNDDNINIMCAYKLCRVEFKYWGMQSKIEKFIHDSALRKTMLRAHRQAWAWQDEWYGMTMNDIRKLERETQEQLARKMAAINSKDDLDELTSNGTDKNSSSGQEIDLNMIDKDMDEEIKKLTIGNLRNRSPSPSFKASKQSVSEEQTIGQSSEQNIGKRKHSSTASSLHSSASYKGFTNWHMESIVNESDSSSNEEFFDAEEGDSLSKWSSLECVSPECDQENVDSNQANEDSIFSSSFIHRTQLEHSTKHIASTIARESMDTSLSPVGSPSHKPNCCSNFFIMVLHGGNILDSGAEPLSGKKSDLNTFRAAFELVIRSYYPAFTGKIAFRLVPCPPICADASAVLSSLSPYSFQSSPSAIDGLCHSYDAIPFGALPLFAISSQEYVENVSRLISCCNSTYQEFLKSEEGYGFSGQVILIGDSVGSIIGFDALSRPVLNSSHEGSENSFVENNDANNKNNQSKSVSPAHMSLGQNPLISISDGMDNEDYDENEIVKNSSLNKNANSTFKPVKSKQNTGLYNEENINLYLRLLSPPDYRRRSSGSSDQSLSSKFDFEVSDFFMFGSPIGLVLSFRKMLSLEDKNFNLTKPNCNHLYNLFHPMDPTVSRIEPLLSAKFSHLPPINVPKYQKFPLGDGQAVGLLDCIQNYSHYFVENNPSTPHSSSHRRISETSIMSNPIGDILNSTLVTSISQKWWGNKRLDYSLYCPEGLTNFPSHSLPHLFHASYWESTDVIAFILRQLLRSEFLQMAVEPEREYIVFTPNQSREKWIRKRTSIKLKNITANHRANDIIVKEGEQQTISARFMYGPLDVVTLAGEKVDIHIMKDSTAGEWEYLSTETTDKTGRISYKIPDEIALGHGIYPIKVVVRGDHTSIDFLLAVIPPKTECVVFSIDGSFTASVSVTGKDPKVRAGAVDVVRHWQELGYLIIYITGRPDMQQQKVISWLSQHNFPFGLVSFAGGLSTDPLKHKAEYLKHLQKDVDVIIHAAYGSGKDIWVYQTIGLKSEQIYIIGKVSKKQQSLARILTDGYAAHLTQLSSHGGSRPAQGNGRMILPKSCFGLAGHTGIACWRNRQSATRTTSYPLSSNTNTKDITSSESNSFSAFFSGRSASSKSK